MLSYDVRILVLGSVCLVFFVWADSTPVKKYCPCFSALYLEAVPKTRILRIEIFDSEL